MVPSCPFDAARSPLAQTLFLQMLPAIRSAAQHAFRRLPATEREMFVTEVIANSFIALRQLVIRGKALSAYPGALAGYAIRQVRAGRRVASSLNSGDVLSPYAQKRRSFEVQSLHENRRGNWEEVLVEDRRATPADIAAVRIDFRVWLSHLRPRHCLAALVLATGVSTSEAAEQLAVTPGRISQLCRELAASWGQFQAAGYRAELTPVCQ